LEIGLVVVITFRKGTYKEGHHNEIQQYYLSEPWGTKKLIVCLKEESISKKIMPLLIHNKATQKTIEKQA
jgi:hypothetical protein